MHWGCICSTSASQAYTRSITFNPVHELFRKPKKECWSNIIFNLNAEFNYLSLLDTVSFSFGNTFKIMLPMIQTKKFNPRFCTGLHDTVLQNSFATSRSQKSMLCANRQHCFSACDTLMDQDISPCNCKGNCPLLCWITGEYCFTIGYHGTVRLLLVRVSPKNAIIFSNLVCFQVYFGHYLRHIDWLVHPPKHFKLARKMPVSRV